MSELAAYRSLAARALVERDHARRRVRDCRADLARDQAVLAAAEEARHVVQLVASQVQTHAHAHLSRIVSQCLRTVYGEQAYTFDVRFERKRGKTEAELEFVRGEHRFSPTEEASGGQVQLAAFGLRLAKVIMQRPTVRRLLVLDEPFPGVDRERAPLLQELLVQLAEELNFQFLVVTHNPALEGGVTVNL